MSEVEEAAATPSRPALWQSTLPWLITLVCFAWLYTRLDAAAGREDKTLFTYLFDIFAAVRWDLWLALMIPYSAFYLLIDTLVTWRVISWFNAPVTFGGILPIRASAYILSIINEQVGKGAIGLYVNRRDGVPGRQIASSLFFIMFCEFYYLLGWATIGVWMRWEHLPAVFHVVPWIALGAGCFLVGWVLFFRGLIAKASPARNAQLLHAFRQARLWNYLVIVLMRSPALLAAVVVYTISLRLFGVEAEFMDMLGYLPVIFFGAATPGPMRTVAIVLWVTLFPDQDAGTMTAFGFVQHNFFIFFNAAIGLLFLRTANRQLFD